MASQAWKKRMTRSVTSGVHRNVPWPAPTTFTNSTVWPVSWSFRAVRTLWWKGTMGSSSP